MIEPFVLNCISKLWNSGQKLVNLWLTLMLSHIYCILQGLDPFNFETDFQICQSLLILLSSHQKLHSLYIADWFCDHCNKTYLLFQWTDLVSLQICINDVFLLLRVFSQMKWKITKLKKVDAILFISVQVWLISILISKSNHYKTDAKFGQSLSLNYIFRKWILPSIVLFVPKIQLGWPFLSYSKLQLDKFVKLVKLATSFNHWPKRW